MLTHIHISLVSLITILFFYFNKFYFRRHWLKSNWFVEIYAHHIYLRLIFQIVNLLNIKHTCLQTFAWKILVKHLSCLIKILCKTSSVIFCWARKMKSKLINNKWDFIWRRTAKNWWVWLELNQRPHPYQGCALTNWATDPFTWYFACLLRCACRSVGHIQSYASALSLARALLTAKIPT